MEMLLGWTAASTAFGFVVGYYFGWRVSRRKFDNTFD